MNRIDRVTSILIHLQSKKIVKAQEIADRFEISLRTVYRDIKTLDEAGIPIVGEAGIGYSIMDGYRLPPIQFTQEEATSFLMAEKVIEQYIDAGNYNRYKTALYKIKAVLRSSEKQFLEEIDPHILVLRNNYGDRGMKGHYLQGILTAINEKRVVSMVYTDLAHQNTNTRNIEPVGIYLQNNFWYLIAYCRLRNDYRTFRVDRISGFELLGEMFKKQHPTLNEYLESKSKIENLTTIKIAVEKNIAKYISTQKYYYGFVSETDMGDHLEMNFLSASTKAFAGWYLTIAAYSRIIAPASLKTEIRGMLTLISERI